MINNTLNRPRRLYAERATLTDLICRIGLVVCALAFVLMAAFNFGRWQAAHHCNAVYTAGEAAGVESIQ